MDPDYLAKFLAAVDATNEPTPTVSHRIRKAIAAHDDVLAMTYTNICVGCGETMPVERELLVCEKCEAGEATPAYNSR